MATPAQVQVMQDYKMEFSMTSSAGVQPQTSQPSRSFSLPLSLPSSLSFLLSHSPYLPLFHTHSLSIFLSPPLSVSPLLPSR